MLYLCMYNIPAVWPSYESPPKYSRAAPLLHGTLTSKSVPDVTQKPSRILNMNKR